MPPSWIPLRRAMHKYCESYFTAVNDWRLYKNEYLLRNRVHLVEVGKLLLEEYPDKSDVYEFDLVYDNADVPLLAEVLPSYALEYVAGNDIKSFESA